MRRSLRWLRAATFELLGASRRARRRLDGTSALILVYHRILPCERAQGWAVEPGMFVTPATFRRHLDWLEEAFRVLPLGEVVSCLDEGRPLPAGACALTFDDGWRDNLEHAWPELRRRRLPATVFVVADRVGSEGAFWPDEVCRRFASLARPERRRLARRLGAPPRAEPVSASLAALKAMPESVRGDGLAMLREAAPDPGPVERELLTWEDLEACGDDGIEFESHGSSHAILTGLPPELAEQELTESLAKLRARGHARQRLLAYPSGAFDPGIAERASRAGYRAAVTARAGLARAGHDLFSLPRVGLHEDISSSRVEFSYRVPGPSS